MHNDVDGSLCPLRLPLGASTLVFDPEDESGQRAGPNLAGPHPGIQIPTRSLICSDNVHLVEDKCGAPLPPFDPRRGAKVHPTATRESRVTQRLAGGRTHLDLGAAEKVSAVGQ